VIVADPLVLSASFALGTAFGWLLKVAIDHAALRIVDARRNGRR
jgi:hypothetical protein